MFPGTTNNRSSIADELPTSGIKLWNWKKNFTSHGTSRRKGAQKWHRCYNSQSDKSKFGFKIDG